jgi:hypothetical protein
MAAGRGLVDTDAAAPGVEGPDQWSDERLRLHRRAVAVRRERQRRAGRCFAIVTIVLVAAAVGLHLPESWWVPAVGAAAVLGLGFRLVNWKCPNCAERLPTRGPGTRCGGCGAPLE